eukprot:gene20171-31014_t
MPSDDVYAYRRLRTDGTVSISGLFFMGNAAKEGGYVAAKQPAPADAAAAAAPPAADVATTLENMVRTALHKCERARGLEFVVSTLKQVLGAYKNMVEEARAAAAKQREADLQLAKLRADATLVPVMIRKVYLQMDAERAHNRRRLAELEAALHDAQSRSSSPVQETPSGTPLSAATPRRKVQSGAGVLRTAASDGFPSPRSGRDPSEAGDTPLANGAVPHPPRSPQGSPPLPAHQRPTHTLGFTRRGKGTPQTRPSSCVPVLDTSSLAGSPTAGAPASAPGSGRFRKQSAGGKPDDSYSLQQRSAAASPFTTRITRTFTTSQDIRRQFDELDADAAGYLTYGVVKKFYRSVDQFGVPQSDAK